MSNSFKNVSEEFWKNALKGKIHGPEKQEFYIWLSAYQRQYEGTGLMEPRTIARQAWQAALNYAGQSVEDFSED